MPDNAAWIASDAVAAVADFAEHEHLRILAEDAAVRALVGEFTKWGDFDLRDAGDFSFDRIFQRDDAQPGKIGRCVEAERKGSSFCPIRRGR